MTLFDAILSALDALRLHKLRSALTMLGIIIGVGAVIAMVAVGGGAREMVVAQIRSLGANLLVVIPGNVTQGGVRLGTGRSVDPHRRRFHRHRQGNFDRAGDRAVHARGRADRRVGDRTGRPPSMASTPAGSRRANGRSKPAACSSPRKSSAACRWR